MEFKYFTAFVILGLFLNSSKLYSQSVEGKVLNADEDVAGVHVLNISTNKATITNADGYFKISATINDTILFSAIQFAKKDIVVSDDILTGFLVIKLSTSLTELDEVVVWPYLLSGDLLKDMDNIEIDSVVTAATLELPNANVKMRIQSERLLYTARTWDFKVVSVKLDPLINAITGRTKMLRKRVARDLKESKYTKVYNNLDESFVIKGLKIPEDRIYDFYYFCEAQPTFDSLVQLNVKGDILKFIVDKSIVYRKNNELD